MILNGACAIVLHVLKNREKAGLVDQTIALEEKMLEQARNLGYEINTLVLARTNLEEERASLDQQVDALARQQVAAKQAQQLLDQIALQLM